MPDTAVQSVPVKKQCSICGKEVASGERLKDASGQYFCRPCWAMRPLGRAGVPQRLLLKNITCPHCWHIFKPESILWIAEHSDLLGDPVLGQEQHIRFLPSRFTVAGEAIDPRGATCRQMACPRCHLPIIRDVLESPLLFISMIGGPGSGKSNLLASMSWLLRQTMARDFALQWGDVDAVTNRLVNSYEEQLFLAADPNKPTSIAKTQEQGDIYDVANIGGQSTAFTRPFIFKVRPTVAHPHCNRAAEITRLACLYDNAGESYLPGADTTSRPYTQHLGKAQLIIRRVIKVETRLSVVYGRIYFDGNGSAGNMERYTAAWMRRWYWT